jgi:Trk K+ transport system NAD-binding subunit
MRIRLFLRDTWLLLREFRRPLTIFLIAIIGGGVIYYQLSIIAGEPANNLPEAIYSVLTLAFLQPTGDFPSIWYLQAFFFLLPIFGIIIIAMGLTDFGVMLFNHRARGKEWEMAVASTYKNHIVVVGLGHLGFRVVRKLFTLDQGVVVIDIDPDPNLSENIRSLGLPIIEDDASRESILLSAGIDKARTIVMCTQNDSLNLQVSLKARNINPEIDVVIRIFDDDFAKALQNQFGFRALSATGMAAPIFAATAADIDITSPITIEGTPHNLARFCVAHRSNMIGLGVGELEEKFDVSVVMVNQKGTVDFHPSGETQIDEGDTIAILGMPDNISKVIQMNNC